MIKVRSTAAGSQSLKFHAPESAFLNTYCCSHYAIACQLDSVSCSGNGNVIKHSTCLGMSDNTAQNGVKAACLQGSVSEVHFQRACCSCSIRTD
ncbi:hypothetical protein D3C80_1295050 [compost metagenome]